MTIVDSRRGTDSDLVDAAQALVDAAAWNTRESPGNRAALRRALGRPPEHPEARGAHAIVAEHLPVTDSEAPRNRVRAHATERAFYTVASLIAAQPRSARDQETGRSASEGPAEEGGAMDVVETTDSPAAIQGHGPPEARENHDRASFGPLGEVGTDVPTTSRDGAGTTAAADSGSVSAGRGRQNLGYTLGQAVASKKLPAETTEARLHLLCRQDVEGVHLLLPRLVGRLRSDLIRIDWVQLVCDLSRWGHDRDQVAKEWLQTYHRNARPSRAAHAASPSTDSTTADGGTAKENAS